MLVGTDNRAIDEVQLPIKLTGGVGRLRERIKEALEDASLPPPVEAAGHGAPRPIALRHITPRRPGAQNPQHAIEDAPMVDSGSADFRLLGWKEWSQSLPLYIGQISSVHAL